jgi:hypothetical protein
VAMSFSPNCLPEFPKKDATSPSRTSRLPSLVPPKLEPITNDENGSSAMLAPKTTLYQLPLSILNDNPAQENASSRDQFKSNPGKENIVPSNTERPQSHARKPAIFEKNANHLGVPNEMNARGMKEVKLKVNEEDPHRLEQRQRQIEYGYNSAGYRRYLAQVIVGLAILSEI